MMKPVRSIKNQYHGLNAHLHSFWQAENDWNNFHNRHIGDLAGLMRLKLLPMGYTAVMEDALQMRRVDDGLERRPRADILVSDLESRREAPTAHPAVSEVMTLEDIMEDEFDEETPYRAIAVYALEQGKHGSPVAWIELLSPSNKGNSEDAKTYRAKRTVLLEQRLVFVEIDYLHETPPTFKGLADYTTGKVNASPYRILVIDPRHGLRHAPVLHAHFGVEDVVPIVHIPLIGNDALDFDFGAAYQKTFEEMGYGLELVDYSQLPLNVERYSPADRTRIANRMLGVLKAARDGADLEANVPLPTEDLPLEAALEQIKQMVA